ncbi:MAG: CheR family methyltransferase [Gammaproteobacteria bacterium]
MNKPNLNINSETYFFRDHGQFDLLRLTLLPELIERRKRRKTLRIWSAGCASGEEAYSLAILIDMLLPERSNWKITIIGSDINRLALTKAKKARYGNWSFRMCSRELQNRYFQHRDGEWVLDNGIRDMLSLREIDLISYPFPDNELRDMDLILCRNVFIYLDSSIISIIANKLAASLSEGGYLMTGHAELSNGTLKDMQSRLFTESVVYQRTTVVPRQTTSPSSEYERSLSPALITPLVTQVAKTCPDAGSSIPAIHPTTPKLASDADERLKNAHDLANRGDYHLAEQLCRDVLKQEPLLASPYFLLAQLAQLKGDFVDAEALLNRTLYLEPGNVAATMELAALYERLQNLAKAQSLRRTVLEIVRALPADTTVEPYEMTASDIVQWLTQSTTT